MNQRTLTFLLAPQVSETAFVEQTSAPADRVLDTISWETRLTQVLGINVADKVSGKAAMTMPVGQALRFERDVSLPPGPCVRADPVHMIPDRDRALLLPPESLELEHEEVIQLVADLNEFLFEDALVVIAPHPHRWYLSGESIVALHRPSPEQLAFTDIGPETSGVNAHTVSSADKQAQRKMKTLMSEIEMYLYTHPINETRRIRSQPAVSGLYLWGTLDALAPASDGAFDGAYTVVGDHPWIHCVADTVGARVLAANEYQDLAEVIGVCGDDQPHHIVVLETEERRHRLAGDSEKADVARERFETAWLVPSTAALESTLLDEVICLHDDGVRHSRVREPKGWIQRVLQRVLN